MGITSPVMVEWACDISTPLCHRRRLAIQLWALVPRELLERYEQLPSATPSSKRWAGLVWLAAGGGRQAAKVMSSLSLCRADKPEVWSLAEVGRRIRRYGAWLPDRRVAVYEERDRQLWYGVVCCMYVRAGRPPMSYCSLPQHPSTPDIVCATPASHHASSTISSVWKGAQA